MSDDHSFATEIKNLNMLRVGTTFRSALSLESLPEYDYNTMKWVLESHVLAEKLAEDCYRKQIEFQFPETSWQMFKQEHIDSWWLRRFVRRFPVKYHTYYRTAVIKIERYASYPEADVPVGKLGRPIPYELIKRVP